MVAGICLLGGQDGFTKISWRSLKKKFVLTKIK